MATRVGPKFLTISGLPGAKEGDHTYLATVHPPSAARPARPAGAASLAVDEWAEPGDVPVTSRRTRCRALSVEAVRALLEVAAEDPDTLARWAIAVLCGLRQGEVLGLQWGRVDFDRRTLTIDRQLSWPSWRRGVGRSSQLRTPVSMAMTSTR